MSYFDGTVAEIKELDFYPKFHLVTLVEFGLSCQNTGTFLENNLFCKWIDLKIFTNNI